MMSDRFGEILEEIADVFGQRSAEWVLDLSYFDSEGCFRNEELHVFAVALRAMETGYGWEFDGNLEIVFEWKFEPHQAIVQIQPRRKIGLHVIDLAILVRGPDDKSMRMAIFCIEGERTDQDNQQDKDLIAAGYRTFRYSRGEMGENPTKCASEISMAIDDFISPRKHRVA